MASISLLFLYRSSIFSLVIKCAVASLTLMLFLVLCLKVMIPHDILVVYSLHKHCKTLDFVKPLVTGVH